MLDFSFGLMCFSWGFAFGSIIAGIFWAHRSQKEEDRRKQSEIHAMLAQLLANMQNKKEG